MEIRPGSGWFGVPMMIIVFALLAFGLTGHALVALLAIPIVYVVVGAVVWYGKRRSD
ncbi:MAG TPA: hypothetical protein VHT27_06850 [Solirubrobacteraceae bacterium]|jgi:hypothetical protein|nr:hypothetical protein [Solirubrobacteraceae bacterium]